VPNVVYLEYVHLLRQVGRWMPLNTVHMRGFQSVLTRSGLTHVDEHR
jgi:hypothetical protein